MKNCTEHVTRRVCLMNSLCPWHRYNGFVINRFAGQHKKLQNDNLFDDEICVTAIIRYRVVRGGEICHSRRWIISNQTPE